MTYREKVARDFPDKISPENAGGVELCPGTYFTGAPHSFGYKCSHFESCNDCWDQECPEEPVPIADSGTRRVFSTGAVRDMAEGKGDMCSLPWEAILRLSVHYENGSKKYKRWNYREGIPVSSFLDSACRHLAKYQCGCDDEDHLAAAAFNVLGAMLMEQTMPEMQDLPLREGKKTFCYFKEESKK